MDVRDRTNFADAMRRAAGNPVFNNDNETALWLCQSVCKGCVHEPDCVLIDVVLVANKPPAEWTRTSSPEYYRCSEFREAEA